jgi:hypothetical protein
MFTLRFTGMRGDYRQSLRQVVYAGSKQVRAPVGGVMESQCQAKVS